MSVDNIEIVRTYYSNIRSKLCYGEEKKLSFVVESNYPHYHCNQRAFQNVMRVCRFFLTIMICGVNSVAYVTCGSARREFADIAGMKEK